MCLLYLSPPTWLKILYLDIIWWDLFRIFDNHSFWSILIFYWVGALCNVTWFQLSCFDLFVICDFYLKTFWFLTASSAILTTKILNEITDGHHSLCPLIWSFRNLQSIDEESCWKKPLVLIMAKHLFIEQLGKDI